MLFRSFLTWIVVLSVLTRNERTILLFLIIVLADPKDLILLVEAEQTFDDGQMHLRFEFYHHLLFTGTSEVACKNKF